MKGIFIYLFVLFSTLDCANIEKGKHDGRSQPSSNHKRLAKIKSGKYGDVSIGISGDTITGVYEYYDKWNLTANQFTDINVFYFFGRLNNNNQITIKAGWPGDDLISGSITYEDGFTLTLEDQPNGYAAVDFVSEGYKALNTLNKNWKRIAIIKSKKSFLYSAPSLERTKVYLISEDIVKILDNFNGWSRIEYNPPANQGKTFTGWIHDSDLYNCDPNKW